MTHTGARVILDAMFGSSAKDEIPIPVFILTYNRPLYLWACLDSLYRETKYPAAKFILADNASSDSLVRDVIEGFRRRRMFHAVHYCQENLTDRLKWVIEQHRGELGEFFGFVECDVLVRSSKDGWLRTMLRIMRRHPRLWMLGSVIDQSDFVDPVFARQIDPSLPAEECEFLIKAQSVERKLRKSRKTLIEPYNPPMRLLLMRTEMLRKVVIRSDYEIYQQIKELGYEAKVTTRVVHRHLSLLNFFDYANYDAGHREAWVAKLRANAELTGI